MDLELLKKLIFPALQQSQHWYVMTCEIDFCLHLSFANIQYVASIHFSVCPCFKLMIAIFTKYNILSLSYMSTSLA